MRKRDYKPNLCITLQFFSSITLRLHLLPFKDTFQVPQDQCIQMKNLLSKIGFMQMAALSKNLKCCSYLMTSHVCCMSKKIFLFLSKGSLYFNHIFLLLNDKLISGLANLTIYHRNIAHGSHWI